MRRSILTLLVCAALAGGVSGLAACGKKDDAGHTFTAKDTPDGAKFLATNAKDPAVKTLPDGLQYKVLQTGPAGGVSPRKGDTIKINYEGKLITGEVFDSSYQRGTPASMALDSLVPGWMEALPMMHKGDTWMVYLPSKLGYGPFGAGGGAIPPDAVLIFKIELIDVLPAEGPRPPVTG